MLYSGNKKRRRENTSPFYQTFSSSLSGTTNIKSPFLNHNEAVRLRTVEWTRRESNPCPKMNSLSFYYRSTL